MAAHSAAGRGEGGFRLPRSGRIHKTKDIQSLLRHGARRKTPSLDVFFLSSSVLRSRWGMIVPKHRHSIVERNRVKRRLREIGRTHVLPRLREKGMALDVLVRARPEAYGVGFRSLRDELQKMTEELC
ncbi:MAG TPA: ribonuclease P protein component [Gemmatimonadetes bacterium]|nr:ribonuclease P protein component [Gemmatimonadota bacterium]